MSCVGYSIQVMKNNDIFRNLLDYGDLIQPLWEQ